MNEHLLFEKKEIYIHEQPKEELINGPLIEPEKIGGRLQILKNKNGSFLRFLPYGLENVVSDDWAFVVNNSVLTYSKDSNSGESCTFENKQNLNKYKHQFEFNELSSVRRIYQGYGIPCLVFMLTDGRTLPNLYFYKGGSKEFLQELSSYFVFKKDVTDPRLWYVQRQNSEQFKQSLYELSLFNEQRENVMKKFLNEPVQSTLLGFSKVTNILRDVIKPSESASKSQFYVNDFKLDIPNPGDDMSDLMDSLVSDNIHSVPNDGYEMVTKVDLGPMPTVDRGPPVQKEDLIFDKEGRLFNHERIKQMIFRGGIQNELRITLWKFLLNYYEWDSTAKSREQKRKIRVEDYFRMKLQWKSISDEQKNKFSLIKERENLIEKDVQRTDRTHPYFESDDNVHLVEMKDILMTYNMFNFDLGYVQGMSDLLAPIMVIMDNEVDSFWCFAGYMDKIESNFLMDQLNIKLQLSNLKALLEFFDSKFSHYLEKNESSNMYFCFRWILILFKREFSFPDINRLWEVLWTDSPCKNFHLLICISILLMKKDDIMTNNYGFNEILKFINDLSGRIDLEKTLKHAEGLFLQLQNFKNVPNNIYEIIGFPVTEKNEELIDESRLLIPRSSSRESSAKLSPSSSFKSLSFKKDDDSVEVLN
ncbi:unnamed protein product [Brachionus calyciflorus]|uniref:TBC1 domain family member 15 n=1 Tax=Brachionus calyciflorus TaxID=104777 RepID=A0A813MAD2_9BILA|nr:unnamed protein product [Brachionus calyciflorus]